MYVDDLAGALDFYRRAFGFETRHFDSEMQYGELDAGETVLAFAAHETGAKLTQGGHARPPSGQPSTVEIAFLTSDVAAAYERAVDAGAIPVAPPGTSGCENARYHIGGSVRAHGPAADGV